MKKLVNAPARNTLQNEKGVAMMLALTTISILAVLAAELVYETQVYHRVVFNSLDQTRAHYLARSGLKIARLQVLGAQKANQFLQNAGANAPVSPADIDQIWQTPIILPPPVPASASPSLKSAAEKFNNELNLGGTLNITINGESGKLNLNRLVWLNRGARLGGNNNSGAPGSTPPPPPPPTSADGSSGNAAADPKAEQQTIRASYVRLINELLKEKKEADEEFARKYESVTGEELIGNLLAWMDPLEEVDGESAPKANYYRGLEPPLSLKSAPLYSLSELHMVKGFDDELVEFFSQNFTASITDGININRVGDDILRAILPSLEEDTLKKFNEKRALGPFANAEAFFKYAQEELGLTPEMKAELDRSGISFVTNETAYRVIVDVKAGDARKIWVADLGAKPPGITAPSTTVNPANSASPPPATGNQPPVAGGQSATDTGPPNVLYLKTD